MDVTRSLHQDNHGAAETSRGKSKSSLTGGRRRKRRKTIFAKENEDPAQRKALKLQVGNEEDQTSVAQFQSIAEDSGTKHEQCTHVSPAERRKDTCFYSDLPDISNDWTAYESLFCDYFD